MLKKTIQFTDLDGNTVSEDFYFNLSKAEVAEMELSKEGGMQAHLERIIASQTPSEIISTFKEIITMSVGVRSEDGRRFIKSKEIADNFVQTDAYSELFMELITQSEASTEFITGLLPKDLAGKVTANIETVSAPVLEKERVDPKPWLTEDREPTKEEFRSMSKDDLIEAMQRQAEKRNNDRPGFSD